MGGYIFFQVNLVMKPKWLKPLEGLAKFGYKLKYESKIKKIFFLYIWLPSWTHVIGFRQIFLNFYQFLATIGNLKNHLLIWQYHCT
jgi:hypothetical protein